MTDRSWFTAQATVEDEAEITIFDEIGAFGVTAKDFYNELRALGSVAHLSVRINSPGGFVSDGLAIHNMLKRHKAHVTVTVDGIAASMASLIAMAGDVVLMPSNAMMMIHDPSGVVVGTSKDMRELANVLDKQRSSLVAAYADKSGMDRDDIAQMMAEETWLSADEAVEFGFADAIEKPIKLAAHFDLSKFKNAPSSVSIQRKESTMTREVKVDFKALTLEQLKAERPDLAESYQAEVKAELEAAAEAEKKAAEEAAAAAAANGGNETPEQIEARVRAEADTKATERAAEIAKICGNAGMTAKVPEFIASGKDAGEIAKTILNDRATSGGGDINNRNPGGNGGGTPAFPSTSAIYDKWNKR